jgi:hypothetical protein
MRLRLLCAAALCAAVPLGADAAPVTTNLASKFAPGVARSADLVVKTGGPYRRYLGRRDCRPYNGPYGYYGNPWCEGGWKYTEDRFDSYSYGTYSYGYAPRPRYRYWRR